MCTRAIGYICKQSCKHNVDSLNLIHTPYEHQKPPPPSAPYTHTPCTMHLPHKYNIMCVQTPTCTPHTPIYPQIIAKCVDIKHRVPHTGADPGWSVRGGVEAKICRKGANFARFWAILEGVVPPYPLLDPPLSYGLLCYIALRRSSYGIDAK